MESMIINTLDLPAGSTFRPTRPMGIGGRGGLEPPTTVTKNLRKEAPLGSSIGAPPKEGRKLTDGTNSTSSILSSKGIILSFRGGPQHLW